MKKIIVLGGTGFVGAHVCEKLVRDGWAVTVPTRRRANANHIKLLPGLTVLELDVHDEAALAQAVAGQDAVVNLVAILHGTQATFERTHVALPRKIAKACLANGVKQLVHISALGTDALQPQTLPSMYLRSKGEGEAVLIQAAVGAGADASGRSGFDLSILRPSVIFGAEDKFLNVFAKLQKMLPVLPLAGANAQFQPVWVEDVAAAILRCLNDPATIGQTYECAGPRVYTLKQLVELAGRLSGHERPVLALPNGLARLQALVMEWLPGRTLMSRDNVDSMRVPNVASGLLPGLEALGISASALEAVAPGYLGQCSGRARLERWRAGAGR